jgi:pyruvate,orthophosphate dikinase
MAASPAPRLVRIVFFADEANKYLSSILVRIETSPEDFRGMNIAEGILTARGGVTSHAAVVDEEWGNVVSGAGSININYKTRIMTIEERVSRRMDFFKWFNW